MIRNERMGRNAFFVMVFLALLVWAFVLPFLHSFLAFGLTFLGVFLIWFYGRRRLEDAGYSQHFVYINFIPILGSLIFLGLCLQPSRPDYMIKDIDEKTKEDIATAVGYRKEGDPASAIYALLSISHEAPEATAECAKQISLCFAELGELENARKYFHILAKYGDLGQVELNHLRIDIEKMSEVANSK